jgi:hypothetical protein
VAQMTESTAEMLDPVQAAELSQVVDLQAHWENLKDVAGRDNAACTTTDLQGRQKAYEAFRSRMAAYTSRYRTAEVPELTLSAPDRFGAWCRAVRAVFLRAEPAMGRACPSETVAKAYRLADRIGARLETDPVVREAPPDGIAAAIRDLAAIIQWCDGLPGVAARSECLVMN